MDASRTGTSAGGSRAWRRSSARCAPRAVPCFSSTRATRSRARPSRRSPSPAEPGGEGPDHRRDEPRRLRRDGRRQPRLRLRPRAPGGIAAAGALSDALGQRPGRGRPQRLRAVRGEVSRRRARRDPRARHEPDGQLAQPDSAPGTSVHGSRRRRAHLGPDASRGREVRRRRHPRARRVREGPGDGQGRDPEGAATERMPSRPRCRASTSSSPATATPSSRRGGSATSGCPSPGAGAKS